MNERKKGGQTERLGFFFNYGGKTLNRHIFKSPPQIKELQRQQQRECNFVFVQSGCVCCYKCNSHLN